MPIRFWIALCAGLIVVLTLVDVKRTDPRVTVRWRDDVTAAARDALERRYQLRNGALDEGTTWRYELGDRSRENIGALVREPAAADTGYLDRDALTAPSPEIRVSMRGAPFPFSVDNRFENRWQLFQIQSLWLLLAGGTLLWTAGAENERRRRHVAIAALLVLGMVALVFPISPTLARMGDANQAVESRVNFENYGGVHFIRFEAHLSYAVLGQLDRLFGRTEEAPRRAQAVLAGGVTAWFVFLALAVGSLEQWSPMIVRYLGLVLLAPCTLLYFGWREVGYLSLNVATFPLLTRGLRDGGWRLDGAGALAGLGAALHGLGLVSLASAVAAALAARARLVDRIGRTLRIVAWATAAYVGWIAIYVIVLKLPVIVGDAESFPWRHVVIDEIHQGRLNSAILSAVGGRDLAMTLWVVGAPLLLVASYRRQVDDQVRTALWYSAPSLLFVIFFWPIQGLAEETDLLVAAFPALYALAWACAHDRKRTILAAVLLVSGHIAFWRIILDSRFINRPVL